MVETEVEKKKRALKVLRILEKYYPHVTGFLQHDTAFHLLIAVILSAQCTDERVNKVTPTLFKKFPTPQAMAAAKQTDVEKLIYSTGFYKAKAKSIIGCSKGIVEKHGGKVPKTLEDLVKLPGVGRKTANVVLSHVWNIPAIVVDTHVKRVSSLLGFTKNTDPAKIEHDLMGLFPQKDWNELNFKLIQHGRKICIARRPQCGECPVSRLCPSSQV
ncbi:MAG: endonuclease III [Deltaproteobacteria bacterium CG11_big_fil_rev_8_21_14_0_20_47_16]|nr:MAG: endonuclease III [Deltaproteobacteria bacterium CG11_big_fil_rev_8_21_14_0_20_47_16]